MFKRILSGIRTAFSLAWFNGWLVVRRSPFSAVGLVLTPLSVLFFIYLFGGARAVTFGIVGGLISSLVSASIVVETDAAFIRIMLKMQDMFVASPVSPIAYVAGIALGDMTTGFPGVVLFAALLFYYNGPTLYLGLVTLYALGLTWASIAALGFLISTFARDPRDLWVYSPVITVLLAFLAPVYYPINILPEIIRPLAYAAPSTYAAEMIRDAIGLSNSNIVLFAVGLLAYSTIMIWLAGKRMRWRDR
jgi:ABC-2 type transport system permease protein